MRKKGFLMAAAITAAVLMAGCSPSSSENTDQALEDQKAVGEAAASVVQDATGDFAGENNLAHSDYLPSAYVTLGDYKGLSVNKVKDVTELSEEDKKLAVEEYLEMNSTQQEITDRPSAEGDYVAVKYTESRDGEVMNDYTDEETEVLLGQGDVLFEEELYGKSAGDKVTATEPMENEDGDGTFDMVYDIDVVRVYSYSTPELTDDFAKETAGVGTAKELEEQIYQDSIDSANEIEKERVQRELLDMVLENSTVEGYPQPLYDSMYESTDLGYQMFYGVTLEEFFSGNEEDIKNEVLLSVNEQLIVEALAEAENIIVVREELDKYKESILEDTGYESVESLSEDYSDQELAYMLLQEKVGKLLEENANITEITEEEYENLTGDAEGFSDLGEDTEGSDGLDGSDEVMELTQSELEALFEDADVDTESDAGEEDDGAESDAGEETE